MTPGERSRDAAVREPLGPPPDGAATPGADAVDPADRDVVVAGALKGLFGRDSLYVGLSLLQVVGAAAVTPVITRVLDSAEFGGTASANAVMQVFFILGAAGLGVAIQRSYAGRDGARSAATLLGLGVAVGTAVGAVAALSTPLWGDAVGFTDHRLLVVLAAVWAALSAITGCSLALLRSQDRLRSYAAVGLIQSVVAEFLSLGLVLVVARTAEAFVWGQVIAQAVACLLGLLFAPPRLPRRDDGPLLRAGLALGLPLVPAMLGGYVLNAADRLIVNAQLGEAAVGRYQVAYNIGSLPMLVLGMLTAVWMPRFFAVEDTGHRDAVLVASRDALYRLLCPVMVGMAVASPVLLRIWAPASYRTDELLLLTAVIVVSAVPYTAGMSANRVLLTRTSTRVIAWAALVASVVNIGLNLVLVPVWGLLGAAVATFVSYAAQWALLARPAALPRLRTRLHRRPWVQTAVVCAVALLTVLLPIGAVGLTIRVVLAVGCLAWFGWQLRRTASGTATG